MEAEGQPFDGWVLRVRFRRGKKRNLELMFKHSYGAGVVGSGEELQLTVNYVTVLAEDTVGRRGAGPKAP